MFTLFDNLGDFAARFSDGGDSKSGEDEKAEDNISGGLPEHVTYICWGEEVCPTSGRDHFQGYVEFDGAFTMGRVKDLLGDPSIHVDPRRGTQSQAIDYTKKVRACAWSVHD